MDIKGLFGKIKNYIKGNTVKSVIIGGSLIIILLLLILIFVIIADTNKKVELVEQEIILTEKQMIPDGPEMQKDYVISRKSKEMWTEEEVNDWFTIPTVKDIDNLGKANDSMINDILGNAP